MFQCLEAGLFNVLVRVSCDNRDLSRFALNDNRIVYPNQLSVSVTS